jgi:hypothetical protein
MSVDVQVRTSDRRILAYGQPLATAPAGASIVTLPDAKLPELRLDGLKTLEVDNTTISLTPPGAPDEFSLYQGAPVANYLANPSFEDGGTTGVLALTTTAYTPAVPGWLALKGHASDAANVLLQGTTVDTAYGGETALRLSKVGMNGVQQLAQWLPPRLVKHLRNKAFATRFRVNAAVPSAARPFYWNGVTTTYGPSNTLTNQWETLIQQCSGPPGGVIAVGVELFVNASGVNVFVDNAALVEGSFVPKILPPAIPPMFSGASSTSVQRAPRCVKWAGTNFMTISSTPAALPLSQVMVDNDNMASGNGLLIQTPGRYRVTGQIYSHQTTGGVGNFTAYFSISGGFLINGANGEPGVGSYQNNGAYVVPQFSETAYFAGGETIVMNAYLTQGPATAIGIHYNGTYLKADRLGD